MLEACLLLLGGSFVCALLTGSWSSELWQEPGKKLELVSVDSYYLENSGVRKPLLFVSV